MRRWLVAQLEGIASREVAVVLDPEGLLDGQDRAALRSRGVLREANDWLELRRVYEIEGRERSQDADPLILLVSSPQFAEPRDLPYDIEQKAAVARVRLPVSGPLAPLVRELHDEQQDRAVGELRQNPPDPLAAVLSAVWGVLVPRNASAEQQLEAVVRLRADPTVPAEVWPLLRPRIVSPLAAPLAAEPPDLKPLQLAWEDWLERGDSSAYAPLFGRIGPGLIPLFGAGLLRPAPAAAPDLPQWVTLGVRHDTWGERVATLLDGRPDQWPPTSSAAWVTTAEWWGEVRAALARTVPHDTALSARAWQTWADLDAAFVPWLRQHFGQLMFSAAPWPATVDRIAGFLARRMREHRAARVLLVVLDGLAFAQWTVIRAAAGFRSVAGGGVFAMIPTLTSVSRQAIFAGMLPASFAPTIRSTAREAQAWTAFWQAQGLNVAEICYVRTGGRVASDVPDLGAARVVGLVVNAVDDLLHGATVLGDAQVTASVVTWVEHGFMRKLVEQAAARGFEVWITSDHGNVEATPLGRVHEGLAVESAGTRVRWYSERVLRQAALADGISWDPPGLPDNVVYPLFAPGRTGYFSDSVRVTHGGLSLDEVIVPLAQVLP